MKPLANHDRIVEGEDSAQALNHTCYCKTLNKQTLQKQLDRDPSVSAVMTDLWQSRPHLFSSTVVFISPETRQHITEAIEALERVIALPAYQVLALERAPAIAKHRFGPRGVFLGFDFHLDAEGPKLIEINTNAGGALLNTALARAQEACCVEMEWTRQPNQELDSLEEQFLKMFKNEWHSQRDQAHLRTLVIVDEDPHNQYLAPEFELFRLMFNKAGIDAHIAAPSSLIWREGQLYLGQQTVDMLYNRLTDFYLQEPAHEAIRKAYEQNRVVITPDPHAHALYADKRNLILLSDDDCLARWGVTEADRIVLRRVVPRTALVSVDQAETLWSNRRNLFFKPVAGFGSKATYRGDKLTKKVWAEILEGDFVAQQLVRPSERLVSYDGVLAELKFDVRAYAYAGHVQLLAARMYAGQTTNFRTSGGGFAPVVVVPESKHL